MYLLPPCTFIVFLLLLIRTYWVQTRIDGARVKDCDSFNVPPTGAASFPDYHSEDPQLTVVHGKLDAARSSLVEVAGQAAGVWEIPVGVAANVSIVSKDSFGNTRYVRRACVRTRRLAAHLLCVQNRRSRLCFQPSVMVGMTVPLSVTPCASLTMGGCVRSFYVVFFLYSSLRLVPSKLTTLSHTSASSLRVTTVVPLAVRA